VNTARHASPVTLATPYLELAGLRWGDGEPLRILALHGWLDNAASFMTLAPLLPGTDLVALDMTGHGRSQHRPPGVPYHLVDFVPDMIAALDSLGWERCVLLGHSMGTGIAALIAAIVPERVVALAMIDGLGPLSGEPRDEPQRLATATRQMTRWGNGRQPPVYADRAAAVAARVRSGGIDEEAAGLLVDRALASCPGGLTWSSDPRLLFRSPCYLTEAQVLAFLGQVSCPALLLEAGQGVLTGRAEMAARRAAVNELEHHRLDGGHHLHLETPELVIGHLGRFLATIEGR